MATEKISVAIPSDLLWAVKASMQATGHNRSRVIADCIRAQLTQEGETSANGFLPAAPSQEDFDALEARVREMEKLAERSGAV